MKRLQAKIDQQAQACARASVGTRPRVLVEGVSRKYAADLCGRTPHNRMVNFPGPRRLIGRFVDVTIKRI